MPDLPWFLGQPRDDRAWMRHGVCANPMPSGNFWSPDFWFPVGETGPAADQADDAAMVCMGCPVRGECLDYATGNRVTDGVWGGVWGVELRRMVRLRSRVDAERAEELAS